MAPIPPSARLLEEVLEEGNVTPTVIWTSNNKRQKRNTCGIWLIALIAILIFLLGICLGAFLNALTTDGGFPLGFLETDKAELVASNASDLYTSPNPFTDDDQDESRGISRVERTESAEEAHEEVTEPPDEKKEFSKKRGRKLRKESKEVEEKETTENPMEEEETKEMEPEDVEETEARREIEENEDQEEDFTTTEGPETTEETDEESAELIPRSETKVPRATKAPKKSSSKTKKNKPKCAQFPWNSSRLPLDLKPLFYNLTIHPNATTNSLQGHVIIDIDVEDKTDVIILHAEHLTLDSFKIEVDGKIKESDHLNCPPLAMWAFQLKKPIFPNNKVQVELRFRGQVLNNLQGLYVSTHVDDKQRRRRSMVTQFEPSYARKVFPSFDEPAFKAEFRLTVIREAGSVVRSNTNLKRTLERKDGLLLDEFNPTVKMSTYLLAFAVLDGYGYARKMAKKTTKPIEVRLYAPTDVLEGQTEFGLDTAVRALEFFEDYFNISYPLEKIDLLALDDFSEGAMENWGLVTFRDSALLYAPNSSSLFREYIALVICHEVAHQWFGNLVTMEWWDDLWLNEGFANYMEYRCVDSLYPEWNIMTRFFVDNVVNSMELDGMPSSRAIASAEEGQALINLFDAIAYHKAAAVIHMIQQLAGEKNFRSALVEYLNKFKFSNAEGKELWKIVENNAHLSTDISIRDLADEFTTQVGYPVIHVSKKKDGVIVAANQTRFLYDINKNDSQTKWPLYISFLVEKEEETRKKWMKQDAQEISIRAPKGSNWVIANSGGIGYFRVKYDNQLYKELVKQLNEEHEEFTALDRTMILADAYDLSRGARLNITTYMDLVEYASKETDRIVWLQLSRHMKNIENLIADTDFVNLFKDFERSILLPAYDKYGWNETAEPTLRFELAQFACRIRIKDCTKRTLAAYNDWQKNKTRPPPEIIGLVLEEGVRSGGLFAFDRTLSGLLNETRSITEKQYLLSALAATRSPELINRLLKLCIDTTSIRPAVVPRVIHHVMLNEVARPIAWRYLKVNFDDFAKILGQSSNLLLACIRAAAEKFSTDAELRELQEFLKNKKSVSQSGAKLEQIYEQVRMNIQWRRLHEENLKKWLEDWDARRRVVQRARRI